MNLKLGDKIIFIKNFNDIRKGEIRNVYEDDTGMHYWTVNNIPNAVGFVANNWLGDCPFILYKKHEIKNDIEWLDRIQQNFSEGI